MELQNEKVEYGKTEIKEKEQGLNEVKVVKDITQDDLVTKKKHIKKDATYQKADAIRE